MAYTSLLLDLNLNLFYQKTETIISFVDNYGIGSYRYIHYTAYANDKQAKVLDGTIGELVCID